MPEPDRRRALDLIGDGGGSHMRFWEFGAATALTRNWLERVRRAQSRSELALSRRKQGFESPRERQ